ncbi:MAG: hypothetical protein M0036_13995 [Desulfobacteraceae bacterium]|nr:hypothetical protein [Desulfobacteraceae bacterium]
MKRLNHTTRALMFVWAMAGLIFAAYACDGGSSSSSSSSTSSTSSSGGCNSSSSSSSTSSSGGGYDTNSKGPYATTQNLSAGPSRASGLFYPSTGSGPFPILVFGCGAGTNPDSYVDHGNYIASWGFIVMIETSSNSGTELTNAIDWLTTQNRTRTSVLYNKCNLQKIAAGGHSRGSIGTFAIASDSRLTTTIHVAGGSFDGNGSSNLRKPAAYICGADDTMATPNAETDYNRTTVPVFMTVMNGVDHISAAREGLPVICAWMLWQLKGETQRQADFLNAGGYFRTGKYVSKSKNW